MRPAQEEQIHQAYHLFKQQVNQVELLLGYEGNAFASTGDTEQDLLSITAVHPMREDAIEQLLTKTGANWDLVEELLRQDKLVELSYGGSHFYLRQIAMPRDRAE